MSIGMHEALDVVFRLYHLERVKPRTQIIRFVTRTREA